MTNKLRMVLVYYAGLLPIKSHDALIIVVLRDDVIN